MRWQCTEAGIHAEHASVWSAGSVCAETRVPEMNGYFLDCDKSETTGNQGIEVIAPAYFAGFSGWGVPPPGQ